MHEKKVLYDNQWQKRRRRIHFGFLYFKHLNFFTVFNGLTVSISLFPLFFLVKFYGFWIEMLYFVHVETIPFFSAFVFRIPLNYSEIAKYCEWIYSLATGACCDAMRLASEMRKMCSALQNKTEKKKQKKKTLWVMRIEFFLTLYLSLCQRRRKGSTGQQMQSNNDDFNKFVVIVLSSTFFLSFSVWFFTFYLFNSTEFK